MLDKLPIAAAMPDHLRVRTELARELRASRVAHMCVENTLVFKMCGTTVQFEDKVTRDYLGDEWSAYLELLRDDSRLVELYRTAQPALALLSPITMALTLGQERRTPYDPTNYSRLVSNAIVDAAQGRGPSTIIVNIPVRHGKSMLASRRVPEWIIANYPTEFAAALFYSDVFAAEWGRQARNDVLDSPGVFGFGVASDATAAMSWQTDHRGGMFVAGIGGSLTGRGASFISVDDTTKTRADAYSVADQEAIYQWYTSTVRTRLQQGAILCLVSTRWSEHDLTGRILASSRPEEIRKIVLPAIAEKDNDEVGRRKGDALWPSRFPVEALEKAKRDVGMEDWFALYQQSPLGASKVGRAYPAFDPDVHVVDQHVDPLQRVYVSFDFNVDPMTVLIAQVETIRPSIFDTVQQYIVRIKDELSIPDSNTADAVAALGERLLKYARGNKLALTITGDATGSRRNTSNGNLGGDHQLIRDYFNHRNGLFGVKYEFSKSNQSVRESVAALNTLFRSASGLVRFEVDPRCRELITDLTTNRWRRDSNGNFLDVIDSSDPRRGHAADACRYLVRALKIGSGRYGEIPQEMPR